MRLRKPKTDGCVIRLVRAEEKCLSKYNIGPSTMVNVKKVSGRSQKIVSAAKLTIPGYFVARYFGSRLESSPKAWNFFSSFAVEIEKSLSRQDHQECIWFGKEFFCEHDFYCFFLAAGMLPRQKSRSARSWFFAANPHSLPGCCSVRRRRR